MLLLCCHLDEDALLLRRAEAVSLPARRDKAAKLSSPRQRSASLAAGLLLRHGLFLYGLPGAAVGADPNGRPFVEGDPAFVSLSHSGDYAACAVSDRPVGVDIQRVVPIRERTVRHFCTPEEWEAIAGRPDSGRRAIAHWALKESYLKASGVSTAGAFAAGFRLGPDGSAEGPAGWEFALCDRIEGYLLAVCRRA